MELSSQDSLTHRISNFLARTTSLIRIKWFLFLIEQAFIWAKVTWRSWLESECLTGPGWGWTSPLRTKVTSTGLKDAVWLVKYATLALENFLRVRGAKWPSARSGTGGRSRLNSFEFDLNSSQNDQGYEEKFALCCGSASSTENSRGTEKHRRNADDIKMRPTAMTAPFYQIASMWQKLESHVITSAKNVLWSSTWQKPGSHVTNCSDWHIFRILIILSCRTNFQLPVWASLL